MVSRLKWRERIKRIVYLDIWFFLFLVILLGLCVVFWVGIWKANLFIRIWLENGKGVVFLVGWCERNNSDRIKRLGVEYNCRV